MSIETFPQNEATNEANRLAALFRKLGESAEDTEATFEDLESDLIEAGFERGDAYAVVEILHDPSLYCRSESFTRVMELLIEKKDIEIQNSRDAATLCRADGGAGFRVAMLEGFSGKDVNATTKVVMTFAGDHLTSREPMPRDSSLWQTKPETAKVSLRGRGTITFDDVQMVSFRFPVKLFPVDRLTEEERERFEEGRGGFVVRHYISGQKKKSHEHTLVS